MEGIKAPDRGLAIAYLCGPMAGRVDHGYGQFEVAKEQLLADASDVDWMVLSPRDGAPSLDEVEAATRATDSNDFRDSALYCALMRKTVGFILMADIIFLLPGWEDSYGARFEYDVARMIGTQVQDGAWLVDPD